MGVFVISNWLLCAYQLELEAIESSDIYIYIKVDGACTSLFSFVFLYNLVLIVLILSIF